MTQALLGSKDYNALAEALLPYVNDAVWAALRNDSSWFERATRTLNATAAQTLAPGGPPIGPSAVGAGIAGLITKSWNTADRDFLADFLADVDRKEGLIAGLQRIGITAEQIAQAADASGFAEVLLPALSGAENITGQTETLTGARITLITEDGQSIDMGTGTVRGLDSTAGTPLVTLESATQSYFDAAGLMPGTDYQVRISVGTGDEAQSRYLSAQLLWAGHSDRDMRVALFRAGQFSYTDLGASGVIPDPDNPQLNTLEFAEEPADVAPAVADAVSGTPGMTSGSMDFDALAGVMGETSGGTSSTSHRWVPLSEPDAYNQAPLLGVPSGFGGVRVDRDGAPVDINAYWEEGDAAMYFDGWTAEAIPAVQLHMERAHLLRAGSYTLGVWDKASQAAMEQVMIYANTRGIDPSDPRARGAQAAAGATAMVGERSYAKTDRLGSLFLAMDLLGEEIPLVPDYKAPTARTPDAATMSQIIRDQFLSRTGRQPSAQEMRHYLDSMNADYGESLDLAALEAERTWIQDYVDEGYVPSANQAALLSRGEATPTTADIDPVSRFYEAFEVEEARLIGMSGQRRTQANLKESMIGSVLTGRSM